MVFRSQLLDAFLMFFIGVVKGGDEGAVNIPLTTPMKNIALQQDAENEK